MLHQHIGWKRDRGRGLGGDCNEVTTSLCSSLQCSILHIQVCWKCAWATTGFVWILDNVIAFTAASRKWLTAGYLAVCKTQFIQIQYFTKQSQHMGIKISLNMHSLLNKKKNHGTEMDTLRDLLMKLVRKANHSIWFHLYGSKVCQTVHNEPSHGAQPTSALFKGLSRCEIVFLGWYQTTFKSHLGHK